MISQRFRAPGPYCARGVEARGRRRALALRAHEFGDKPPTQNVFG